MPRFTPGLSGGAMWRPTTIAGDAARIPSWESFEVLA